MDNQSHHALKGDKFAQATQSGVTWIGTHRSNVVRVAVIAVVVVVVVGGLLVARAVRGASAETALGAAIDTYSAPLAIPGAPAEKGVYNSAADRAKAANQQFVAIADQYGWLPQGAKAHYFAGVTYAELGQNGPAESELKTASSAWNRNIANLAKLALAGLYHQTGRDQQAIDLYNEIVSKPSETVTAPAAQLDLADLYAATGKQDQARSLWAKIKDADKDGAAGSIATQKLAGPSGQ